MQWTPRTYQLHAAQFMLERPAAGLLLAPGLGKTSTTLAVLSAMKDAGVMRRALVIAPLRPAYDVWPTERVKWNDFAFLTMQVLHGPKKEQALAAGADVSVINPEGLQWLFMARRGRLPFDTLIVDESTKFKNPSSQRFKTLRNRLNDFKRRYILTGTVMPNRLEDIWAQVFLLDGGARLGAYITHFRRRYMIDLAPKHADYSDWQPRVGAVDEVREKIADLCLAMRAEDYLDMPELIVNDIEVDLPADARVHYRELRDQFITELSSGVITASNAGSKAIRLRQVANGRIYDDHGVARRVHDAKFNALDELIEEQAGDPLLVAVAFLSEAAELAKKYDAPYLGGGVPAGRASEIIRAWNAGDLPVLFAHPTSVAHGLNLQAGGRAVCWFGLTYNREEYDQFIARVYRQGQERGVVVHRILARGTIDAAIVETLESKDTNQKAFINALRSMP